MEKKDISLVKKYVEGEDLGDYSIDDLENDADFMIEVINYSNDYKMYSFCSDEVKKNYDLVKCVVLKFKERKEFVIEVADYYFNNTDTDWERKELGIIMETILPRDLAMSYGFLNDCEYLTKRVQYEYAKAENSDLETTFGMGFLLMFDDYSGSDIILGYYAKRLVNEIIDENSVDFRVMLRSQFKSADEVEKIGVNNYLINFIGGFDSMLSSYVSMHLDLIKPLANKIQYTLDNWDSYLLQEEAIRYRAMLNMVHEYMHISNSSMNERDAVNYIANELGILEKLRKFDDSYEEDKELEIDYDEEFAREMIGSAIATNLKERKIISNVRKIIMNQLFSNSPSGLYSLIDDIGDKPSSGTGNGKIIKFNPSNKK